MELARKFASSLWHVKHFQPRRNFLVFTVSLKVKDIKIMINLSEGCFCVDENTGKRQEMEGILANLFNLDGKTLDNLFAFMLSQALGLFRFPLFLVISFRLPLHKHTPKASTLLKAANTSWELYSWEFY